MPAQTKRRVFFVGKTNNKEGSAVISLPKDYVRYHELTESKEVTILYDNILVVIPPNVKLPEDKLEMIKRLLE